MRFLFLLLLLLAGRAATAQDLLGYHTFTANTATQSIGELRLLKTVPLRNGDFLLVGSHAFNSQERDGFVFRVNPAGQRVAAYYAGGLLDDAVVDAVEANGSIYVLVDLNQNNQPQRRAQVRRLTSGLSFIGSSPAIELETSIGEVHTTPIAIDAFPDGRLVVALHDAGGFVIGIPGATWPSAGLISVSANLVVDFSSRINVADSMHDIFVRGTNVVAVGSNGSLLTCDTGGEFTTYARDIYVAEYSATLDLVQRTNYISSSNDAVIDAVLHDNGNIGIIGQTDCPGNFGNIGPDNVGANNFGQFPTFWLIDFEHHNLPNSVRNIEGGFGFEGGEAPVGIAPADCGTYSYLVLNNLSIFDIGSGGFNRRTILYRYEANSNLAGERLYDEEPDDIAPTRIAKSAINRSFVLTGADPDISFSPDPDEVALYRFSSEGCANPDWCEDAEPWPCDAVYNHTTEGYTSTLSIDDYTCYTSPVGSEFDGADRIYAIDHPGGSFSVTLTSTNLDFDLFLFNDCDEGGDHLTGGNGASCVRRSVNPLDNGQNFDSISEADLPAGRYYVVVDAPNGLIQGPYQIDFRCCTVESFLCDEQYVVPFGGSSYRFAATNGAVGGTVPWTINGITAADFPGVGTAASGNFLDCDFSTPGDYQICYFVSDPENDGECSGFYCCRDYCIDFDQGPGEILYSYNAQTERFNFSLDVPGFPNEATWFDADAPESIIGTGSSINISLPNGNCRELRLFVRYFDVGSQCYRTVRRVVWLCDPFACGSIGYSYFGGAYQLTLTGAGGAQNIVWQDDATGQIIGTGFDATVPINGNCGFRDYSVRYRTGGVWRICCIRIYVCDPFQCGLISETYVDGPTEGYQLTFSGPANGGYTWTDDDIGITFTSADGPTLFLPFDGECRTRNISVRYYDPVLNRWRICCYSLVFCPENCDDPQYSLNCGFQTFFQFEQNNSRRFTFSTSDGNHPNGGSWLINRTSVSNLSYATPSASNAITVDFPTEATYEVCYETRDEDGCVNYCCRNYCVDFTPDEEPIDFIYDPTDEDFSLSFSLPGASNISWYDGLNTFVSGSGASFDEPISSTCGFRTFYFRYFQNGCWRTAKRRVTFCDPRDCTGAYANYLPDINRWRISYPSQTVLSSTWFDADNGMAVIAEGGSAVDLDPRPPGQCGIRTIVVRFFDGFGWRYCRLEWVDCDPYDCSDFTTAINESTESLNLTFTGPTSQPIGWIDDATGEILLFNTDQTTLPLSWPEEGCVTRFLSVVYFDPLFENSRLCCIEVEVCRPEPCEEPAYFECPNGDFYRRADGGYRINANQPGFDAGGPWLVNRAPAVSTATVVNVDADGATCYFPAPGTYEVCYPYTDAQGCVQYCCRTLCVDEVPDETPVLFNLADTEGAFVLALDAPVSTPQLWYTLEGDAAAPDYLGDGPVILPFPEECYTRTFYCRYRTNAGCWRVVARTITVCNPRSCGNIAYAYNAATNAFDLTLEAGFASNISWYDDDNNQPINFTTQTISVTLGPVCGPRNISVRYWDGTAWRICCLRYEACDPFACNRIEVDYEEDGNVYILELEDANGLTQFSWRDDVTGQQLMGSGPVIDLPVTGNCRRRDISVRYFDPVNELWVVCCVSYWQCAPEDCGATITDEPLNDEVVRLSVPAGLEDIQWAVAGADAGAGEVTEAMIPLGQTLTVCVRYFDPTADYWRICCREVTNPDCDPPLVTFTTTLPALDSLRLTNTNVENGTTYAWAVDGIPLPSSPPSLTLHLPPGPHEICLTGTNDCAPFTECRTIGIPDPDSDLIFDIENDLCGTPGSVISVPVRVYNFTGIDAFDFTFALPPQRRGRFVGFDYVLNTGAPAFNITNDSTLALSWVQSGGGGTTIADGTVMANLRIQLDQATAGNSTISFADFPIPPFYNPQNGLPGVPALIEGSYGICLADAELSGTVRRESGTGIADVEVALLQNGTLLDVYTTDLTGTYTFTGLTPGEAYTIRPSKDINHRNGVNAGDESALRRHIFQQQLLASPYQRIAANVINFAGIESSDRSQLRQLIFQDIPRFTEVDSWHFVPADYVFPDPENPLQPAYPDEVTITAVSGTNPPTNLVAVKMGDLNESALPGQFTGGGGTADRSATDLQFLAAGTVPRRGQSYRVNVLTRDFTEMVAAQFSLGWDTNVLRFDSVSALLPALQLSTLNFSFSRTSEGQLPWLWSGEGQGTLADSTQLFSLHFTVVGEAGDTATLRFTEDPTPWYFEDTEGQVLGRFTNVEMVVEFPVSTAVPAENEPLLVPNPAHNHFRIQGLTARAERLELYDTGGRLIRTWNQPVPGVSYSTTGLPSGVYLAVITSRTGRWVEKLIIR